jgi:hypothetical protein
MEVRCTPDSAHEKVEQESPWLLGAKMHPLSSSVASGTSYASLDCQQSEQNDFWCHTVAGKACRDRHPSPRTGHLGLTDEPLAFQGLSRHV